ncbi:MAG: hypothetical protein ACLFPV_08555 [Spirochaetaceae bacterium]
MEAITPSMTAPMRLFARFRQSLAIKKGALLLPDPDGAFFSPWSSIGFDRTTEHRMRIPESRVPAREEVPDLVEFRPYFSVREFSMLDEMYLYPFLRDNAPVALLLVTDSPYLRSNRPFLSVICAAVSDTVSELIYKNREERMRGARFQAAFSLEELASHLEELDPGDRGKLQLVLLSANKAVGALVQEGEANDEYRIRQDVMRVVSAMVSGIASIADVGEGRILLALHDGGKNDLDLLLHQLSYQAGELFPEIADQEKFSLRTLPTPGAEGSIAEHLRSVLP